MQVLRLHDYSGRPSYTREGSDWAEFYLYAKRSYGERLLLSLFVRLAGVGPLQIRPGGLEFKAFVKTKLGLSYVR